MADHYGGLACPGRHETHGISAVGGTAGMRGGGKLRDQAGRGPEAVSYTHLLFSIFTSKFSINIISILKFNSTITMSSIINKLYFIKPVSYTHL